VSDKSRRCSECSRKMVPVKFQGRTRTAKFVCSNEGGGLRDLEECNHSEEVVTRLSGRHCPNCASNGMEGAMVELGMHQDQQGYEYTQEYTLQCLTCHKLWVEVATMKDVNAYRFDRGFNVQAEAKEVEAAG